MVEYLVLSGAGPNGLGQLGIIKTMLDKKMLDMKTIKKVYGTSAGASIGALLILDIDINQIIEYCIYRPWNKLVKLDMESVFHLNEKKGMLDNDLLKQMLIPLLNANDIPVDITLKDAYAKTNVELHIMTTELSSFTTVTLNHLTFPDLKLVDACCMSASVPPLFTPVYYLDKYYIDGGILNNYPVHDLMRSIPNEEHDKILSIRIMKKKDDVPFNFKEMSAITYAYYILNKSFGVLGCFDVGKNVLKHEIICLTDHCMSDLELWKLFMGTIENRQAIYEQGVLSCESFLNRL
jgi:NTE family protein